MGPCCYSSPRRTLRSSPVLLVVRTVVHVPLQTVESLRPRPAVPLQPQFDHAESLRVDAVEPSLGIGSYAHEPRVLQDLQMLRDGGLRHVEAGDEIADGALAFRELIDDGKPSV